MPISVLLVDDHRITREGVRALLQLHSEFEVVAETDNGLTAIKLSETLTPDIVVMDIQLPGLNGIDVTQRLLAVQPTTRVICLSAHKSTRSVQEIFRAGALGYVVKDAAFEDLIEAMRNALLGRCFLSPSLVATDGAFHAISPRDLLSTSSVFEAVSHREREVLQLISEGFSTKQVAHQLGLSVKTIETHRRNLMEKLHIESVAELTRYAIREGLTPL